MINEFLEHLKETTNTLIMYLWLQFITLSQHIKVKSNLPKVEKIQIDIPPEKRQPIQQWEQILSRKLNQGIKISKIKHRKYLNPNLHCPRCGAPVDYLYSYGFYKPKKVSVGQRKKFRKIKCILCEYQGAPKRHRKRPKFFCPYCHRGLEKVKTYSTFDVYKCRNKSCPKRQEILSKLHIKNKAKRQKISYIFRDYHFKLEQLQIAEPKRAKIDISRLRFSLNLVSLALTFSINMGLSTRETAFWLNALYSIKISHTTINNWIITAASLLKKFVSIESDAVLLVADETEIKIEGEKASFLAAFDPKTERLVICHIVFGRANTKDAATLIYWARLNHKNLQVFVTDANPIYQLGMVFLHLNEVEIPEHVIIKGLRAIEDDKKDAEYRYCKNLMERFFRTFKQRYRRTHGFSSLSGAIAFITLFSIFYNFFRPHQKLDLKSPYQLRLDTSLICEKWAKLIELAIANA